MYRNIALAIVTGVLLMSGQALTQSNAQDKAGDKAKDKVGVEEKLGQSVPLETVLARSDGTAVKLGDLLGDHPVIMRLVYYE